MRALWMCLLAGVVGVGMASGLALAQQKAESKTVEGELVDLHCYSAGGAKGEKHAACAKKCMASGIPAGVLVDGKAWTLATNPAPLAEHASKTVRVTGKANADAQVLIPDKIEVKDGDSWTEVKMKDAHRS